MGTVINLTKRQENFEDVLACLPAVLEDVLTVSNLETSANEPQMLMVWLQDELNVRLANRRAVRYLADKFEHAILNEDCPEEAAQFVRYVIDRISPRDMIDQVLGAGAYRAWTKMARKACAAE